MRKNAYNYIHGLYYNKKEYPNHYTFHFSMGGMHVSKNALNKKALVE